MLAAIILAAGESRRMGRPKALLPYGSRAFLEHLIEVTRHRLRKLHVRSVEQVRGQATRLVGLSPRAARENKRLKDFLYQDLYSHQTVSTERKRIVKYIEGLFDCFVEDPRRLPASYITKTQQEPAHRIVCDYIAGMTDNYLIQQYQKHLGE